MGDVPVVMTRPQLGCIQDSDQTSVQEQFLRRLLLLTGLQRYIFLDVSLSGDSVFNAPAL